MHRLNEFHFYAATNATNTLSETIYQASAGWITVVIACSLMLLGFGILGIICESKCLAPNRFDSVLSHTYDNPQFEPESGASTVDVEARLKQLGNLEVRVGDVSKGGDVGRIGLGLKSKVQGLKLGKLYE
ncbi:hypothetical protein F4778DRAFT_783007 [Xylariomycetidae sp. FL2044]|nr:hypothetical protein F4778DRAFT_783007 [Xylariomycetidae sp. FL2044]